MGRGQVHAGGWWRNVREREHSEVLIVNGKIILKCKFKKWDGSMDWINVGKDRDRWRALVNAAMNLRFP
jgi:hypothetical protein